MSLGWAVRSSLGSVLSTPRVVAAAAFRDASNVLKILFGLLCTHMYAADYQFLRCVRVARALPDLPKISEYFARGQISYSKVRAISRVASAGNEAFLLSVALRRTASHLERLTAAYRKLDWYWYWYWYWDDDGMLEIHGKLSPGDGALFIKYIEFMASSKGTSKPPRRPAASMRCCASWNPAARANPRP